MYHNKTHLKKDRSEFETQLAIAGRAQTLYRGIGIRDDFITISMDIENAHAICPMKLDEWLTADDSNFAHDMLGIRRHLNRRTLVLEDGFLPRFAKENDRVCTAT